MQVQELVEHLEEKKKRAPLLKRWWAQQLIKLIKKVLETKASEAADKVIRKL